MCLALGLVLLSAACAPLLPVSPTGESKAGGSPVAQATALPTTMPATTTLRVPAPQSPTPEPPTPTPPPTSTPTLPATATPIPPSLPAPVQLLALRLDQVLDADGHLTAGIAGLLGGRASVVLGTLGRSVYCLSGEGVVRWRARAAGPVYAVALLDGDRVAAGDDAGQVTAWDASGRHLAAYDLGTRVTALAEWGEGLLAGGWDERLSFLALAGSAWQVRWQVDLGAPLTALTTVDGLAVAGTASGELVAFDASGAAVWRLSTGSEVVRLAASASLPGLLAGLQDGRLLALSADGRARWEQHPGEGAPAWVELPARPGGTPAVAAGSGGAAPALTLLSPQGTVLWQVALPSPANALAAADLDGDGEPEILAGLDDGQVVALDVQGRQRGTAQAGLAVWGLVPISAPEAPAVVVLADVAAWRLAASSGPAGASWLRPPALLVAPAERLPASAHPGGVPGEAVLAFLGDVSLGRSMEAQLARYGPAYPWVGLGDLWTGADLAVVNLEVALTVRGRPMNKPYVIRAHPRWGASLVAGGIDVVSLANNHVLDYGFEGLDDALEALDTLGVLTVGAGRSAEEARRPALVTLNGVRVAVLAYAGAYWNGSADIPATDRIAWAQPAAIAADVRAARGAADVVVVIVHAGVEYSAHPSESQVAAAHAAVDAGAALVVGHHPHVTQTVERYRGVPIVYSLGDAVFDIPRQAAMQGDLLRVGVTKDGLAWAELWPFWIDGAIRPHLLDDGQGEPRFQIIYP